MKTILILLLFFATFVPTFSSCGGGSSSPKIEKATDVNGAEYKSRFLCPMRCKGSGSAQAGKCPACKMDYVANAHFGHNHGPGDGHGHGHDHGHDHSGHNHKGHNH